MNETEFQAILGKTSKKATWRKLCPKCDSRNLGSFPFLCGDGVWRSLKDLETSTVGYHEFCGLKFTEKARLGAKSLVLVTDKSLKNIGFDTASVETLGVEVRRNSDAGVKEFLNFSSAVCKWGRGQRVWANLLRLHGDERKVATRIKAWLSSVSASTSDEAAVLGGAGMEGRKDKGIKGLGVSFASKHLRMFDPERFAVLDSRYRDGLGFALNPKGYAFFMRELRGLKSRLTTLDSVASLEMQLFTFVRQQASAEAKG